MSSCTEAHTSLGRDSVCMQVAICLRIRNSEADPNVDPDAVVAQAGTFKVPPIMPLVLQPWIHTTHAFTMLKQYGVHMRVTPEYTKNQPLGLSQSA